MATSAKPAKAQANKSNKAEAKPAPKVEANPAPKGWAPTKGVQRGQFVFWQARIREASLPVSVYLASAASTPSEKRQLATLRKASGQTDSAYYVVEHRGEGERTTGHGSWHHGAYAYCRTLGGAKLARTVDPAQAKAEREAKQAERVEAAKQAAVEAERKGKASTTNKRTSTKAAGKAKAA